MEKLLFYWTAMAESVVILVQRRHFQIICCYIHGYVNKYESYTNFTFRYPQTQNDLLKEDHAWLHLAGN